MNLELSLVDLAIIGEIIKAQGIKGELKIIPYTDNLKRFGEIQRVYWREPNGWHELFIESYRPFKEFVLLKFKGINDLTQAENLGRCLIYILKQERPKLPNGRYYYDQIEGLQVFTITGEYLGTIDQVIATGSNDVYSVRNSSEQLLLPALESVIKQIDLGQGKMLVELPPGLREDAN